MSGIFRLVITKEERVAGAVGRRKFAIVVHACLRIRLNASATLMQFLQPINPSYQVRNVQNDPAGQSRACIPESLQVKWHFQNAMKQTRIADHAHEEIIEEILVGENAMILFKLLSWLGSSRLFNSILNGE